MRKFLLLGVVLFLIIFLIGFFSFFKNSNFALKNSMNLELAKKNINLVSNEKAESTNSLTNPLLNTGLEIEEIKREVNNLIKEIKPDSQKNVSIYIKELKSVQQKYSSSLSLLENKSLNKNLVDSFFNLSQDVLKIRPPEIFYETHLKISKAYLSLALASQKYLQTNDDFKKMILYNFMESQFNELKSLINE